MTVASYAVLLVRGVGNNRALSLGGTVPRAALSGKLMMGRRAAVNVSVAHGNEACPFGKSGTQRKKVVFFSFHSY